MDMSVWFLMGAALVFFMQCGFAMVEAGFTRSKNVGNITMKDVYKRQGLREKNGNDKEIQDYVLQFGEAHEFLDKLTDMIDFLIPNYIIEGKNQLVISIGCTGGKHRSVTLANELYKRLSGNKEYGLKIEHRDIEKDALDVYKRQEKERWHGRCKRSKNSKNDGS